MPRPGWPGWVRSPRVRREWPQGWRGVWRAAAGERIRSRIGAPRGVEQLRITLVQVAHLREVPLRIGLGNCVSGHVFLRLTHAACMGLLRGDRTGQILPPRDHLHETWATLGDHFKGLWSGIGRVLAQHRDVWKCALGRWSLPAKLDASWTATLLALPPLFPAPCLRVCARPAPASSIGGSVDDRLSCSCLASS